MNKRRWAPLGAIAIVALGLGALRWMPAAPTEATSDSDVLASLVVEGAREISMEPNASEALGVDAFRYFEVSTDFSPPVWIYAGLYYGLGGDAQIHAPDHCYPGSGFGIAERSVRRDVAELVVENGTDRRLVWYQYRTARGPATAAWQLKRDMLLTRLLRSRSDGLLMRVSTPLGAAELTEHARARLQSIWDQHAQPVLLSFSAGD